MYSEASTSVKSVMDLGTFGPDALWHFISGPVVVYSDFFVVLFVVIVLPRPLRGGPPHFSKQS